MELRKNLGSTQLVDHGRLWSRLTPWNRIFDQFIIKHREKLC